MLISLTKAVILGGIMSAQSYPPPGDLLAPCDPSQPTPRWVLVVPDGTPYNVTMVEMHGAARVLLAYGDPRIFCSGFEDYGND